MAEGEGHEDKEDLFEDLDKFFAPIQDVDWPETAEPAAPSPPSSSEPEPPEPGRPEEEAEVVVRETPPPAEEQAPTEDLFASRPAEPPTEAPTGAPPEAVPTEESPEEGIEAFLFGEEPEGELEIGEAIEVERLARPPEEYVALPGPSEEPEEPEPSVAEALEEEPTAEEIEAAAEHFAESVREDVVVEPEAEVEEGGYDTQPEAGIEELLGTPEEEGPVEAEPEIPVRTVRVGAEDLGGPSWQEPTAVEVGPEAERGGPGRNVQLAFLTGIVLAALAVGAIAIAAGVFAVLAGIVVLVAQGEFYFALQKRHYQPATALGLVTGALALGAGYYRGEAAMLAIVVLGVIASFLWYMTVPAQHRRNVVSNIGLTALGVVWIPMFAGYILILLPFEDGRALVLAILGLTIAYDASAFAVGYFWGSRPLAPSVSPKKSWEGAIGATLVVIAVAVGVVAPSVDVLDTIPRAVGLAVVVALFAPFGDLAESLVKRDLNIKDMGSILPGHGGILDRIDGMLFVVPAAALYLRLILA